MFAAARTAAGRSRDEVPGDTVGAVLSAARERYGSPFADVLATCRVWVNGEPATDGTAVGNGDEVAEPATDGTAVGNGDEVAVLPPVSGGAA